MKQKAFGKTMKTISEIGFGSWQLGNNIDFSSISTEDSIHLVHEAVFLGINFFDTAPNYGHGKSEELLGMALKNKRNSIVISTKFGHQDNGYVDFSEDLIKLSVEKSLKRLQTDYIDSILLHNPNENIIKRMTGHFDILEDLKKEGKILTYGASVDTSKDMITLMTNTNSSVIETMFNIFHQETKKAFNMAKEKDISLIAKVPLDSGWLTGKYKNDTHFNDIRNRWSREVIERRFDLLEKIKFIASDGISLSQRALQFILSYPEITTVIPGTKNIGQLKENIASCQIELPEEMKYKLIKMWEDYLQYNPLPW